MNIQQFRDFMAITRDTRMVPQDTLLIEATKPNYFFFSRMMGQAEESFRGGTQLVDKIMGDVPDTFAFSSPMQQESPVQTDHFTDVKVDWAFARSYYVQNHQTTMLNKGDPDRYVDELMARDLGCVVDTVNGMETALWTLPNYEEMESASADPRHAYSILSFVTRDGLSPSATNGGVATGSSNWTTLETINPSVKTWFQNKRKSYTVATPDDPDNGLIASFDDIVLQTNFERPDGVRKWSEHKDLNRRVIVTNKDGVTFYKARLRNLSDRMERLTDPSINGPQFEGVPIKYVSELDNAGWTAGQPDYLFLDLHWLKPFFHPEMYMMEVITDGGSTQPLVSVVWKFSAYNLFCRSRRRQGRIYAA